MYEILSAVKERMESHLLATANLTSNTEEGEDRIVVDDASVFTWEGIDNRFPEALLMDSNTTGKKVAGGYEGAEVVQIEKVQGNEIIFRSPLSRKWYASNGAKIKRAPFGVNIAQVVYGDLSVVNEYPAIAITPMSKTKEWYTLSGTWETYSIDFMAYTKSGDTEDGVIENTKLSDVIEYILMTNLHIPIIDATSDTQVTSRAIASPVNYGVIQKGSEFIKASKITWVGEAYLFRGILTQQGISESPLPGPL